MSTVVVSCSRFIWLCVILNKTGLGFSRYNLPPVDPYKTIFSNLIKIIS